MKAGDCPDWKAHEGLWTGIADMKRHMVEIHGWPQYAPRIIKRYAGHCDTCVCDAR